VKFTGIQIDPEMLMTRQQALDKLAENGEDYQALCGLTNRYSEQFGNELYWHYPLCDTENAGLFILPVREGFLCLPYDTVEAQDHELLELNRAFMLDAETAQNLLEEWDSYATALSGAMRDMVRILQAKS
jgi:hypothetical protein